MSDSQPTDEDSKLIPKSEPKSHEEPPSSREWRDVFWLFLFIAHLAILGAVAVVYGPHLIDLLTNDATANSPAHSSGNGIDQKEGKGLFILMAASIGVSVILSALWLSIMKAYSGTIIKISMVLSCLFLLFGAFASFVIGQIFMGIILLLFVGITALYYWAVQDRIPLAEAILEAAVTAINDNPGTVVVSYLLLGLQIVWVGFWGFTLIAIYSAKSHGQAEVNGLAYFFLVVSFYWTLQVLKNIAHVTTAGAVGWWWLEPAKKDGTWTAFKCATTFSLGSICLGSLLIAIIQAVRQILNEARKRAAENRELAAQCILCLIDCCLSCIEGIALYFNKYVFTTIALHGQSFVQAGRDTWELIQSRAGLDMLINDDLSGMVMVFGAWVTACASAVAGVVLAFVFGFGSNTNAIVGIAIATFLIGFMMTILLMTVVESAVASTFVLMAEDPHAMHNNRQNFAENINVATERIYNDVWINPPASV